MATKENQAPFTPLGTGERALGGDEDNTCFPKHWCSLGLLPPCRRGWGRNSPVSHNRSPLSPLQLQCTIHSPMAAICGLFSYWLYRATLLQWITQADSHKLHNRAQNVLAPVCLSLSYLFLVTSHALQPHWHSFCPSTNKVLSHLRCSCCSLNLEGPSSNSLHGWFSLHLPGLSSSGLLWSPYLVITPTPHPNCPVTITLANLFTRFIYHLLSLLRASALHVLLNIMPESSTVSCA